MTFVFAFDHPHQGALTDIKQLLGSKAANITVMVNDLGLPVPPGFTISTAACRAYLSDGWPDGLDAEIDEHLRRVEGVVGRRFGDPADPLLVSVRSGAPLSMPGMMDTILNLGLNDATTAGLAAASGDPAFAADCQARFIRVYRDVVGVDAVPDEPRRQLRGAVEAVFRSWNSDRARAFRAHEGISDDLGTGVTIQTMVFGNRGADSGSGVLFTRNPATGEAALYGDVMFNAQGEDVVAGTHQTEPISVLDERLPDVALELRGYADALERHFTDCCDIEFTIEQGRLWMLQVRIGKRSPQAAVRMAVEMAESGDFPLSRADAVRRVAAVLADPPCTTVRLDAGEPLTTGLPASPGVASGEIALTSEAAIATADAGRPVILVRSGTSPDDVHGMARSAGILTSIGGLASHAAVVARGWAIPAVVGATAVQVRTLGVVVGDRALGAGDTITIDGTTGEVFAGSADGIREVVPEATTLLGWAGDLGIAIGAPEPEAASAVRGPESAIGADPSSPLAGMTPDADMTPDAILRVLVVKGYATPEAAAIALDGSPEDASEVLDRLSADGLVELAAGSFRLTADGKTVAYQKIAADTEHWGAANAVAALDAFLELDHRMKETVTTWQLRDVDGTQTFNDHSDPAYDAAVIASLADLHADASAWIRPHVAALPRMATYAERLDRAVTAARDGDQRYVASPRVDSYHSVWFELHEDLILLSGRTRADEVAAGRA